MRRFLLKSNIFISSHPHPTRMDGSIHDLLRLRDSWYDTYLNQLEKDYFVFWVRNLSYCVVLCASLHLSREICFKLVCLFTSRSALESSVERVPFSEREVYRLNNVCVTLSSLSLHLYCTHCSSLRSRLLCLFLPVPLTREPSHLPSGLFNSMKSGFPPTDSSTPPVCFCSRSAMSANLSSTTIPVRFDR